MSRRKQRRVLRGAKLAAIIAPPVIIFSLRDFFAREEAAPIPDPLAASPGPGGWVGDDVGDRFSILDGQLVIADEVGVQNAALFSVATFARAAGLAMLTRTEIDSNIHTFKAGWDSTQDPSPDQLALHNQTNGSINTANNGAAQIALHTTVNTTLDFINILRSMGGFQFVRDGTSGEYLLLWVEDGGSLTPLTAIIGTAGSGNDALTGSRYNSAHVVQLPAPFNSDFGFATQRLAGARSAGDTFNHIADCFIQFIVTTVPSALQIELLFRIQDATNYWVVTVDSAGDLDLDEVVAGVPTQRGTAAAVVTDGERVAIRPTGTEIRVFDSAARITFTNASNFQTETTGELDTVGTAGVVSDIVSWPGSFNFAKFFVGA